MVALYPNNPSSIPAEFNSFPLRMFHEKTRKGAGIGNIKNHFIMSCNVDK